MHLLFVVMNNEELLDDLITGWLDMGITGATVVESTDSVQLISSHVPIFAGFRALTSGGVPHNKTIFTVVETDELLERAVEYLNHICDDVCVPHQGVYFAVPLTRFGRLGEEQDPEENRRHLEKKLGKPIKSD